MEQAGGASSKSTDSMSTTFDTFESLFTAAIEDGILPRPASYQAKLLMFNYEFNEWLGVKLNKQRQALPNYHEHLTPGNFKAFIDDREAKLKQAQTEHKAQVQKRWQVTPEPQSWQELFTVQNWQDYMTILCDAELLIHEAGEYRPAPGVKAGCIAAAFRELMMRNLTKANDRDYLARALSRLLPSFSVSGATVTNVSKRYQKDFEQHILKALKRI
jgi:hypothetical protein